MIPFTLYGTGALFGIALMEEIKLFCFTYDNLNIFPKNRDRLAPYYHRKLILMYQWNLIPVKVAPVDLCPCTESYVLNQEFTTMNSEDHGLYLGGLITVPSEYVV